MWMISNSVEELQKFKEATMIMSKGKFKLHKWHINAVEAESTTGHSAADKGGLTTN